MNDWLQAKNLLAVRLDNIGDVVMLGPALRAVKETTPDARITLMASPAGAAAAPLLAWVDDVIVHRSVWQDVHSRVPFDPAREMEFIQLLSARHFDGALIFTSFSQTPHVPGYVCYLAGIPLRAGDSCEFAGGTLTNELRGTLHELHQAERNLRLVEELGFRVRDRGLSVSIPPGARDAAAGHLRAHAIDPDAPFILLHPGASARARRYPSTRFGEVAQRLIERGHQVLVTGVEREGEVLDVVLSRAPEVPILQSGTSLEEYAALIERASLVVCGNTLPLHLADALGTPLVVLYSGTDLEEHWRPRVVSNRLLRRETPCHPCYLFECPIGQPCLDISVDDVVTAVESMPGVSRLERVQ